jgi:hypothetical protein
MPTKRLAFWDWGIRRGNGEAMINSSPEHGNFFGGNKPTLRRKIKVYKETMSA